MALRLFTAKRGTNLRGCLLFRDVGGCRTHDGLRTRDRRLFHADSLHRLTVSDRLELDRLGLASVIDLRTPEELAHHGPARIRATQYLLPFLEVMSWGDRGFASGRERQALAASYYSMLQANEESLREILAVLSDRSTYPAVVSCSSGVKRTGLVTALVLGLLGVPDDVIVEEFASTMDARLRISEPSSDHLVTVAQRSRRLRSPQFAVGAEVMTQVLKLLRADHGTFVGYAGSVGMAGAVPYLRAALLEL